MKSLAKLSLYFLIHFVLISSSAAEFNVPALTAPVIDQAEMLSPNTRQQLDNALRALLDSGGSQLQVLTVNDLAGLSIEEASIKTASEWKLGDAKEDKGVLLLISKMDRKVRIEVGQGLEGDLPDAYAKRIIDLQIIPFFKLNQFEQGIVSGVIGILQRTDPNFKISEHLNSFTPQSRSGSLSLSELALRFIFLMIILFIIFNFPGGFGTPFGGGVGRGRYGGGGFGGTGGSRGGWSGGGGGFSGGGASGGW